MLEKTICVMEIDGSVTFGDGLYFSLRSDDLPHPVLRELTIKADLWEELGRPNTLTMTIEPGDKLNTVGDEG